MVQLVVLMQKGTLLTELSSQLLDFYNSHSIDPSLLLRAGNYEPHLCHCQNSVLSLASQTLPQSKVTVTCLSQNLTYAPALPD